MMKYIRPTLLFLLIGFITNCKSDKTNSEVELTISSTERESVVKVIPIKHGTLVLEANNQVIYVDPTGGAEAFKNQKQPTIILITDIHGDHFSIKTLETLNLKGTSVIVPKAVSDKIPSTLLEAPMILNNGEKTEVNGIKVEAIPMYNLRAEALKYHEKGRGNGYLLSINSERIYISGDTEDIPEMRNLENIDKAFVCMNLPYTMPIESAADAVLEFKPKTVYPYHYRGSEGMSDVNLFKKIVNERNDSIEVLLLEWY